MGTWGGSLHSTFVCVWEFLYSNVFKERQKISTEKNRNKELGTRHENQRKKGLRKLLCFVYAKLSDS